MPDDTPTIVDPTLFSLLDVATMATSREEFRREALRWVDRNVGFDTALLGRADPGAPEPPTIVGFDASFFARFQEGADRYAPSLVQLITASAATAAPVRDVDVFSQSDRAHAPFYNEIIGPKGSRVMVVGAMVLANSPPGSLQISRTSRGAAFSDRELAIIRGAQPILALGDGLHRSVTLPPPVAPHLDPPSLSPRELDVLEYVSLGLTNADIALACGTAKNTVRNQVASLLRKVGASSRAELVALALGAGLIQLRCA